MSYQASRNLILAVFTVLSVSLIALSIYVRNRGDYDTRSEASSQPQSAFVLNNDDLQGIPSVISVDPKTATEDQYFTYYMNVVDSDNELNELDMYLLESPTWLHFDPENQHFFGMPKLGELDTEKVVLQIDDGENLVEHTFYLLILPADEQST
jgi:hypothetical protein